MENKSYTEHWKNLANDKKITATDVLIHSALKAFFARGNVSRNEVFHSILARAFTPITNSTKLVNDLKHGPYKEVELIFEYISFALKYRYKFGIFGLSEEATISEIFDGDTVRFDEFKRFVLELDPNRIRQRHYTYIFVDQDMIEPIYQAVQAAHVAMVIGQKMNKRFNSEKIHYQICKKPDVVDFEEFISYLMEKGVKVEKFYEPDVDRTIAIGTHPIPDHKRKFLMDHELLTF